MSIKEAVNFMRNYPKYDGEESLEEKKMLEDAKTVIFLAIKCDGYNVCRVDEAIKKMEYEKEYAYADFTSYAEEIGIDDEYDSFYHKGLARAIEILKEACL